MNRKSSEELAGDELVCSFNVQFEPCHVGDSCCFAKVEQPSATRGSHSAWSRCRHQSHPSPCQANSRGPSKKRCASPPPLDLAEGLAKLAAFLGRPRRSRSLEEEFGVDPGVATTEAEYTEVLNGGGSGGSGLQRLGSLAQVQRTPRARHECPGVITATHETRVRNDPSRGVLEPSATSAALLRLVPNFTKCHRDGCRSPQPGQNRRIRTPARYVVQDPRDIRVCIEGQWLRSDLGLDCPISTPHQTSR